MDNLLCQNAREEGLSLGEASENGGVSFTDMAKTAGAAAIGSLVVGLGIEAGKRLIYGKPVFGSSKGRVVFRGDVANLEFETPEQAEKAADAIKDAAKDAREKQKKEEERAKEEKSEAASDDGEKSTGKKKTA